MCTVVPTFCNLNKLTSNYLEYNRKGFIIALIYSQIDFTHSEDMTRLDKISYLYPEQRVCLSSIWVRKVCADRYILPHLGQGLGSVVRTRIISKALCRSHRHASCWRPCPKFGKLPISAHLMKLIGSTKHSKKFDNIWEKLTGFDQNHKYLTGIDRILIRIDWIWRDLT